MAKKILVRGAVKRQKNKLYYIDGSGNVCEATMNRKGGKKGRSVCAVKKRKPAKRKPAKKKATRRKSTAKRRTVKRKR